MMNVYIIVYIYILWSILWWQNTKEQFMQSFPFLICAKRAGVHRVPKGGDGGGATKATATVFVELFVVNVYIICDFNGF